ncbi:CAC1S protein, partial [Neodrepanis coruscans]|nr:CAC1S protein [Neodrepanis coruscans]
TVTGTASSLGFQQGESGDPNTSSTPTITFLMQEALVSGSLEALAHDSSFVAVTRDEMAASSQLEMDEVKKAAVEMLKERQTLQGTKTCSAPLDATAMSPASSPGLNVPSQKTTTTTYL